MKFTLTFEGDLPPNGGVREKWAIRSQFHPQLVELWQIHPNLRSLQRNPYVPTASSFWHVEWHHSVNPPSAPTVPSDPSINLCEPVERGQRKFLPLVRERIALKCGLKILFLRKEDTGRIYQGGDLDNRLKTLFDALSVPQNEQVVPTASIADPIYCLLEDDGLITAVNVETHRLLARPSASKHQVLLVVEVDIGITQSRLYNQAFLGD
jgi:hypothetical protein